MKINYLNKLSQVALMTTFILMMTSCTEALSNFFSDDIEEGEEVLFTTALPSVAATRTTEEEDKYNKQMEAYQAVNKAYEFTVEMYEGGNVVGTSTYQPAGGDSIGTLSTKENATPLYWTSTTFTVSVSLENTPASRSPRKNVRRNIASPKKNDTAIPVFSAF